MLTCKGLLFRARSLLLIVVHLDIWRPCDYPCPYEKVRSYVRVSVLASARLGPARSCMRGGPRVALWVLGGAWVGVGVCVGVRVAVKGCWRGLVGQ